MPEKLLAVAVLVGVIVGVALLIGQVYLAVILIRLIARYVVVDLSRAWLLAAWVVAFFLVTRTSEY